MIPKRIWKLKLAVPIQSNRKFATRILNRLWLICKVAMAREIKGCCQDSCVQGAKVD